MSIEKYGHKPSEQGPGSEWDSEKEQVVEGEHTVSAAELLSDAHYDTFVRYGYARSVIEDNRDEEYLFWKGTYDKMQNRRVGFSHRDRFDGLIADFEKRGFEGKPPIPTDKNYDFFDGSHRVACSAALEIRPRVIVYSGTPHTYDRAWFESQGFSEEELAKIDQVRDGLLSKLKESKDDSYAGVIWGVALEYWEEILGLIPSPNLRRAFIKDFEGKIEDFIKESYVGDGMSGDRIDDKARKLFDKSSKVGMIMVDFESEDDIVAMKKRVREQISQKMDDYFFDNIIHIIDNREAGREFFKKHDLKK